MKNVLEQILNSYNVLTTLQDKSGDLEIIKLELLKINGFFQVITKKIGTEHYNSSELTELKSKVKHYLENYYFEREIEILAPIYSEDVHRLKNIRYKIIEALNDKKLMDKIETVYNSL